MNVQSIKVGDKIELVSKTRNKDIKKFYSQIQNFDDEGNITILAPIENSKIIPLSINKKHDTYIYTSRGLYNCETIVTGRKKSDNLYFIELKVLTKMKKFQRRQFYRLDCILTFLYKYDEEEEWKKGTILDISGGGLRFTSHKMLEESNPIICNIKLDCMDNNDITMEGSVVSSNILDFDTNNYEHRIEFNDITKEQREVIIKYIFDEQRKRRKKEKGM